MKRTLRLSAALALLAALPALADPATGWKQTAAGTYDYNDAANWVDGDINGIFGSDLTLAGAQTITFSQDTTLSGGLTLDFAGGYKVSFVSDGASNPTVTLGGDISVGAATKNSGATFGSSTAASNITLDLGGTVRTVSSSSGNASLVFYASIVDGGIVFENAGEVNVPVANAYTDGTWLSGNGLVKFGTDAFGTGPVHFGTETTTAKINTSGNNVTFTHDNPLFLDGNVNFENAQNKSFDLGAGDIAIARPLTFTVAKNTITLRGQVASNSPCGISAITKAGATVLATHANVVLNGEEPISVTGGTWQFRGVVSGTGTWAKTGGGGLELMTPVTFSGLLAIRGGTVRFRVANALGNDAKVLIEDGGILRSNTAQECNYAYSVPRMISSGIIDPASTGIVAFSSNEEGDIDLSNYPTLRLGANGGNFGYTGVISVSEGRPFRLGGGGSTITLKSDNALSGTHDIEIGGGIAISGSNDIDGTVTLASGITFTIGVAASAPNMSLIAEKGATVNFNGAGGERTVLKNLTLRSATLALAGGSNDDSTHVISGTLTTEPAVEGGVSRVTATPGTYNITLRVGSLSQGDQSAFLYFPIDGLGTTDFAAGGVNVVVDNPAGRLAATGVAGTTTAPVFPWVRVGTKGHLATLGAYGLAAIDAANEQSTYADGYEGAAASGVNLLLDGAVANTLTSVLSLNSIEAFSTAAGSEPALTVTDAAAPLLSGAIATYSEGAASIDAPLDFGANTGYISFRKDKHAYLKGSIAGTGGIVFADGNANVAQNKGTGFHVQSANCTFTGDVIVQNQIFFDSATFLPGGVERRGNLYLYAPVYGKGITLNINGLYGTGSMSLEGSAHSYINVGLDGSDGDYSGNISTAGSNVHFSKNGGGRQRLSGNLEEKYSIEIKGGILQADGVLYAASSGNSVIVYDGATLAGCGTIRTNNRQLRVDDGGILAPGSAEIPNQPMTVNTTLQLNAGSALRFYIDDDRASQLIVTGPVTGTDGVVPVTIEGNPHPNSSWMLMEAASFTPTFKTVQGTSGSVEVRETETTVQLWYVKPAEATVLLFR